MPLLRHALAACLIVSTPAFARSSIDATASSGITIPAAGTANGFDRPVCWGDFDGDGDLFNDGGWDVYLTNTSTSGHVFHEWDPTTSSYVDNAVAYGIAGLSLWATAVTLHPAHTDGIKTTIDPPRSITLQ